MAELIAGLARSHDPGFASVPAGRCADILGMTGVAVSVLMPVAAGEMIWQTDGSSARLDDLHFTLGQGPAVDAATFGELVLEPDLADVPASRWPAFTTAALDLGVRAVFAVPLQIGAIRLGVVLAHRDRPGPPSDTELSDLLAFADAAVGAILGPAVDWQRVPRWFTEQPAGYSAQIHQATGMISAQLGVDQADALIRLRARAFSQHRALADVAADVVARRLTFSKDDE
jgi:ANTAR domain